MKLLVIMRITKHYIPPFDAEAQQTFLHCTSEFYSVGGRFIALSFAVLTYLSQSFSLAHSFSWCCWRSGSGMDGGRNSVREGEGGG